jgi:hypothetical protein
MGIISGLVVFATIFPYVTSILRKETVPNRVTWIIWSSLGLMLLFSTKASGATETLWFAVIGFTNPFIILLFSFKYGVKEWTPLDTKCLAGATLGVIGWKLTGKPEIGIVFFFVADLCGLVPTVKKVRRDPTSESFWGWIPYPFGCAFGILAIQEWRFGIWAYPVFGVIASLFVVCPLVQYHSARWYEANRFKMDARNLVAALENFEAQVTPQ